jgi:hypothetical protein
VTFTVNINNKRPTLKFQWQAAANAWADRAEPVIEEALREAAPQRTGELRKSVRGERAVAGASAVLTFTAVDYARYVIDGTRPHEIRPRHAQALFWPGAQHPVAVVHHPGTRPNDFVARALEPLTPEIQAAMDEAIAAQFQI